MISPWTFEDRDMVKHFDSHIRSHLPWYNMMHDMVVLLIKNYVPDGGNVVDVGASTGNLVHKLLQIAKHRDMGIVAVEKSYAMEEHMEERFGKLVDFDQITILRNFSSVEHEHVDAYVACLTLSFVNPSKRQEMIDCMIENAKRAVIIVDKVCDHDAYLAAVLRRMTLQMKLDAGVSPQEALIKEMSLSGVQIPLDPSMLGEDAKQFFRIG